MTKNEAINEYLRKSYPLIFIGKEGNFESVHDLYAHINPLMNDLWYEARDEADGDYCENCDEELCGYCGQCPECGDHDDDCSRGNADTMEEHRGDR